MEIKPRAMRDAFLEQIWLAMHNNEKIFFLSADFGSPVLDKIRKDFPNRFANVGIAEQNLINVAAGLATEGFTVFAYAIAPFITMRCYEQSRVNLALLSEVRDMNVNLIGVGAGYSYVVSGPTHQCYEDITLMRAMPNFRVLSPSDHVVAESLIDECLNNTGPKYLRFDAQILPPIYEQGSVNTEAGFSEIREGDSVCLIATGYMVHTAMQVAEELEKEGVKVGLIDLFDLSGLDSALLSEKIKNYKGLVSLEEAFKGRGGLDALLFNFIQELASKPKFCNIGVHSQYEFELGTRQELHEKAGIGPVSVKSTVKDFMSSHDI